MTKAKKEETTTQKEAVPAIDNLKTWNSLARPPKDALKKIVGGRLGGMTDISPQWRYKIMTDHFGPCGQGWKYEIVDMWTKDGAAGVIMAFAKINLYVQTHNSRVTGSLWSEPIPGIGGSMLVAKEKAGLHNSDEAFKMAVTDALGTALKMLGVAADIYLNKWDGTKYKDEAVVVTEKINPAVIKAFTEEIKATTTLDAAKLVKDKITKACAAVNDLEAFEALKVIYIDHRKFIQNVDKEDIPQ